MNLFIGTTSLDDIDTNILNSCDELINRVSLLDDVNLVYGAYNHGIMKKCYDSFKNKNKKVIASTVKIYEDELKNIDSDQVYIGDTTFDRIKYIYENSDMFLILPGGIGTMAELLSLIEEMRTEEKNKMIILYNKDYFYKDLLEFLYKLHKDKLIEYPPSEYMFISNDIDEIIKLIENF